MSTNLATLMVGLGYDLSALEKGSPEAFRLINSQTLGMSAEMKRASREGAEAFRSIDEMIGIHINRPMTRLLVETFPQFGKALADVLGGVAFGAVAFAGVELFDRIAKGIENAKKAQEEWRDSAMSADETIQSTLGGLANKLADLKGRPASIRFAIEGAEEAKRSIDEISKALDKESEAAENAQSFTSRLWTGAGELIANGGKGLTSFLDAFGGDAIAEAFGTKNLHDTIFDSQALQNMKAALADMRTDLQIALNDDKEKGTHTALTLIQNDIKAATAYLKDMQNAGDAAGIALAEAAQKFFENAGKIEGLTGGIAHAKTGHADAEANQKAIHELQGEMKGWNEENNRAFESWLKLNEEIEKASAKLNESVFKETGARAKQFALPTQVLPPVGAPTLKDQEELMRISGQMPGETSIEQQTASWQKAGQILEQIETPIQKYNTGLAVLKQLQADGRISAEQLAQAEQQLGEKMTSGELHLEEMQKQLEELLAQSTSARAGVQAFFLSLQIESSQNGKAAFDLLNQGLKSFEDTLTKAVFDGKAKWKDMFRSMGEEAFKLTLNKEFSGIFSMIGQTGIGKRIGLAGLLPGAGGVGGAGMAAAATTLQTGSTTLLAAATTLQAAAANLSVAGVGGAAGGGTFNPFSFIPGRFASGTDSAPGGFAWVGEQGPELAKLPAGTSISPAGSSLPSGAHVYQDFRGAVVSEELMRKADFQRSMSAARKSWLGEAVANFSEIQKRTPRR